jgi:hypothetical protein
MTPHQARALGFATLATWLVTASIGGFMLRTWVVRGGLSRQRATGVGVPPQVVFGHAGAAVTGLLVWAVYLGTGTDGLAWLGVGVIATVITLGICTVTLWTPYPLKVPGEPPTARPQPDTEHPWTVTDEMIASLLTAPPAAAHRRRIQLAPLIPACHGAAALATFLLATLTATSALG